MILYICILVSLVCLDAVWLSLMAQRLYKPLIGHLMADTFSFASAALFYPLYAFGLMVFVLRPALQQQDSLYRVFLSAALFGMIAYAAYDLTNQATLKSWPWTMTIIDMAWGAMMTGLTCVIAITLVRWLR